MYNRTELRVILIGEMGVGKKSIVKRFKMLNCSELKFFSSKEDGVAKLNNNNNINKNKLNNTKTSKDKLNDYEKKENDERNFLMKREEKRIELMNFSITYKIRMNYLEVKFYPCIEAIPLEYDYESKEEDDDLLELEREYKFTLRPLIKEIKDIILTPPENQNTQLEFLFLLCFDLSNIESYNKLMIYFTQIEKRYKIVENFKVALLGNKMDKKITLKKEEKDNINKFKKEINAKYYKISTLMFFPFDKFFENLILDNFEKIPLLNNEVDKNLFHETLLNKNNFSKAPRQLNEKNGISGEIKFKYNKDIYEYPSTIKGLMKIFQDPDKFNKSIFLTKIGALLPPIKKKIKDKDYLNVKTEQNLLLSKMTHGIKINSKNKEIKDALELTSRKPGYSFGFTMNTKSQNLKKQRKALSEARYTALDEFIKDNSTKLYNYKIKNTFKKDKAEKDQLRYENNRKEIQEKRDEDFNIVNEERQKRHLKIMEKNSKKQKEKIDKILQKKNKYDIKYSKEKQSKEKKRMSKVFKNNLNITTTDSYFKRKIQEPKAKFYTPKSSIMTNKGFSFGHKFVNYEKIKKIDYPDFPLFKDDFEKILLKNKKIIHTSTGKRFPEEKEPEIIDDSKLKSKQKNFEKNRELNLMNKTLEFNQRRQDWKDKTNKNKLDLEKNSELILQSYIDKTYNGDFNYLQREINYTQVETSSPKYTFREKTFYNSIFAKEENSYNDDFTNNKSTGVNSLYLENPDSNFTHMRFPKFSFGKSKRFNITSNDFKGKEIYYPNTDYNYTQSFLKAQTFMGTAKKPETKFNGVPGPNAYEVKRFADDVVEKGKKFDKNKNKLKNIDNFLETH